MHALEKRLGALEAAVPTESPPRVIFLVPLMRHDEVFEPWSARASDDATIDRLSGESNDEFYDRVATIFNERRKPGQLIPLVACFGRLEDQA